MSRSELMLSCLKDGRPWSRREIFERAGFMLTNNAAAELRAKGYDVDHSVADGVHFYHLQSSGPVSYGTVETPQTSPAAGPDSVQLSLLEAVA